MTQTTLFPRQKQQIAPGAVHIPNWLNLEEQRKLLALCRDWAKSPAGLYAPVTPHGLTMSVRVVSLGWHWYPYHYSKTRDDGDPPRGAALRYRLPCKPFPPELEHLSQLALQNTLPEYQAQFRPDVAIVNWYSKHAKLGMHQDRSESETVRRAGSPIISISLGDSCLFRFGNTESRSGRHQDVELASGDLFVFGGASRMAFHGVMKIYPGTAPQGLGMRQGRLSITIRASGFNNC